MWNAQTGREEATLTAPKEGAVALAYSQDAERVMLRLADRSLIEWDTKHDIVTPSRATFPSSSRSPDAKRIVVGSHDGSIEIKDAATGTLVLKFTGPNKIDPAKHRDVIAKEIRASGMGSTLGGIPNSVVKCAFSPDGSHVVSATDDETLQVWDASDGSKKAVLEGHAEAVTDFAISLDGKKIVSTSRDNTLKLWDGENGALLSTYAGHADSVNACAFSPNGGFIVSASADKTLRIWDANQMQDAESFSKNMGAISVCSFSPDGMQIATGNPSGVLTLWDAETGEKLKTRLLVKREWKEDEPGPGGLFAGLLKRGVFKREEGAAIIQACYSPDGKRILTASLEEADVALWDAVTAEQILTLGQGGRDWVRWCAFSPDGKQVASGHSSGALRLWDANSGTLLLSLSEYTDSLVFSSDGKQVLSGSEENPGVPLALFNRSNAAGLSPDGFRTVSVLTDKTLTLSEAESASLVAEYVIGGHVECVTWHPAGQKLVLGDAGGQIHILRLENLDAGSIIATAWSSPIDRSRAVGCPLCRQWSEVKAETLGKDIACSNCGNRLKLNSFTIDADWRPVAKAWGAPV